MKAALSSPEKESEPYINMNALVCLPPGCEQKTIRGLITVTITLKYLNVERDQINFRCKLWGREGDYILFPKTEENQFVLQMTIRSSFQVLSKYMRDMEILCVECLTTNSKPINQLGRTNTETHSHKQAGWIFVNFKRYIINHLLDSFQETANIVDLKKQKIGEANVRVQIRPYEEEHLPANQPIFQKGINHPFKSNQNTSFGNLFSKDLPPKEASSVFPAYPPTNGKNNHSSQPFENRTESEHNTNRVIEQEESYYPKKGATDKKGKSYSFVEDYLRNKPANTQLSLIRQKFGYNYPSVEVMKLKLDEVQLLTNQPPIKTDNLLQNRLNLLLKNMRTQAKTKMQTLIIYCQQSSTKIRTQTIITLPNTLNGKCDINYLYILPNFSPFDVLTFECKEARTQITVEGLQKTSKLQLKSNAKRSVFIQYALVSEKSLQKTEQLKNTIQGKGTQKQQQGHKKQQKEQESKTSLYISVHNWPQDKILLKNSSIGTVSTSKIIFEVDNQQKEPLQIQLQKQNNSKVFLKVDINHLYKEQTYLVDNRQVKIISAKGSLPEILNLVNLNSSIKSKQPTNYDADNKQERDNEWSMKDLALIMEALQKCQNQECSEFMRSMQSSADISLKYVAKLAKIINIDTATFKAVLQTMFDNQFGLFYQCFHAYHRWNHKYRTIQKKIRKIIEVGMLSPQLHKIYKRLKKNPNVIFGIVESGIFLSEFANRQQKMMTQQMESQLDKEELNKLIVLILERYVERSLKLNELQSFLNSKDTTLNLNSYLLSKICAEILRDPEGYREYLIEEDWQFLQIIKQGKEVQGQQGLAKLIFTAEQQPVLSESSELSANDKMQTQHLPYVTEQAIHTEQSKKSIHKQFHQHSPKPKIPSQKDEKQTELISIVLNKLLIPNEQQPILVQLLTQKQNIYLDDEQLVFPKALSLYQGLIYTVTVKTNTATYDGTFIATPQTKNVKLFSNQQQAGVLRLSYEPIHTQQSQIPIRIISTQKAVDLYPDTYQPDIQQQLPSIASAAAAKSPFVKLTIRSLRPSRVSHTLTLSTNDQKLKKILFPNQNQLLLPNNQQGWKLQLTGEDVNEITISNQVASNTYCFCNEHNNKVICTAIIELQQCWDENSNGISRQSNQVFAHIDQLVFMNELAPGKYEIVLENSDNITKLHSFQIDSPTKTVYTNICLSEIKSIPKIIIKVIEVKNKKLIAEFKFAIKLIPQGVLRHSRYLIAEQIGVRLLVVVFQIQHDWTYCKGDKILKMFGSEGRRLIEDWLGTRPNPQQQQLIYWLKVNFKLTLGEVDIVLNEMLSHSQSLSWKQFISLFSYPFLGNIKSIEEVTQEFIIFDLYQEGMIAEQQLRLVKKILEKGFKPVLHLLEENSASYENIPQRADNSIIDLSSMVKPAYFDYLSFVYWIRLASKGKEPEKQLDKKQSKQIYGSSSNLRIKLRQFVKLSLNGAPCTLLFKISEQTLAEPIHRCYSHKYSNPIQITVPSNPHPKLQINCRRLNGDGIWEYKSLQTVAVAHEINILGGTIYLQIAQCSNQIPARPINPPKIPRELSNKKKQNILPNKQPQPPEDKHEDDSASIAKPEFEKSFWNRSLNETKEKWARSQNHKAGQTKEGLNNYQLNKQELMQKMKKFDQQQWE